MSPPLDGAAPGGESEEVPKISSGDLARLVAVYEELRRAARGLIRRRAWDEMSLEPTGLVHEACLRLSSDPKALRHPDPKYLFGAALTAMRRILVERARERAQAKRGGSFTRVGLDRVLDRLAERKMDVFELNDAIDQLARRDERQAQIITMKAFLNMKVREIAEYFGLSESTIENDLAMARAWLRRELRDGDLDAAG